LYQKKRYNKIGGVPGYKYYQKCCMLAVDWHPRMVERFMCISIIRRTE